MGIGFRDERRVHTGDGSDVGPGPTIEVDPSTWERVDHPLGELAESQQQGYRYLITAVDGTVTHLRAREAVPATIEVDPPAVAATATSEPPPDRFPGVAD